MSEGKMYGKRLSDPDQTAVTGPLDFGTETVIQPRLEDLPVSPPLPPPGIGDTVVDSIPTYRDPYEPFTRAEEAERAAQWEQEQIRDPQHLREVIGDELNNTDVAEEDPYRPPVEYLPHNIFDMVTTTQFAIRINTRRGGVYITRWMPLSEYEKKYSDLARYLDDSEYLMSFYTFAVEEGMQMVRVGEIESFTFFSREWYEAEYQQRRDRDIEQKHGIYRAR